MPEISRFFGISIRMYYDDHGRPHFHAMAGGREAVVGIEPLAVIQGRLTPRTLGLVFEWASLHTSELRTNWDRARRGQSLNPIAPLE